MQNYYRVKVQIQGGLWYLIQICDKGGDILRHALIAMNDDVPWVILDGLKQMGQRFVGSLPFPPVPRNSDRKPDLSSYSQQYWVVTEPIVEAEALPPSSEDVQSIQSREEFAASVARGE